MEPKGRYLSFQVNAWQATIGKLDAESKAPLEYPLGSLDWVSELLIFQVHPDVAVSMDTIERQLERQVQRTRAERVNPDAIALLDADNAKALVKVKHRSDGGWQVWPWHGHAPFSRVAHAVMDAASCIRAETGGEIRFWNRSFDEQLRQEMQPRLDGLSVDFFGLMQSGFSST
ncbi:MAG TPA: hypothetical protein VM925_13745 [Labilithrix sp.]|nr:hypothetical protein [Labilithrix sp.]